MMFLQEGFQYSRFAPAACNWWGYGCCGGTPASGLYIVFAGLNGLVTTTLTYMYDAGTKVWTAKTAASTARYTMDFSTIGTNAYGINGNSTLANTSALTQNERYQKGVETWQSRTSAVDARGRTKGGITIGASIFVTTGISATSVKLETTFQYIETSDSYAMSTDLPGPKRSGSPMCSLGFSGYVLGGQDDTGIFGGAVIDNNQQFSGLGATWATNTVTPVKRATSALFVLNSKLYYNGGFDDTGPSGSPGSVNSLTNEYDPSTDSWASKTSSPTADAGQGYSDTPNGVGYRTGNSTVHVSYTPDLWTSETSIGNKAGAGVG